MKEGLRVAGEDNSADAGGSGVNGMTGQDEIMQGLYARHQTELFIPEPVKDVSSVLYLDSRAPNVVCRVSFQRITLEI